MPVDTATTSRPQTNEGPVMGSCDPGLKDSRHLVVKAKHCADALGSGDVPVLGTPALLTLAESACVSAICDDLPAGQTSVGAYAEIEHLAPTPIGQAVDAEARLIGHHGRRLEFQVIVRQGDEIVAKIRHRRVLVDRDRFLAKVGVSTNGK
jgi:fluoroacetyl-CoA thioesterase